MDRSRRAVFPKSPALKIAKVVAGVELPPTGTHKLRVTYGPGLKHCEITTYEVRPVSSVCILDADDLRYGKKFDDRTAFQQLMERRGNDDDVLIIQHGHVTDTSYANVAFYDGSHWYTPALPLLRGTRRDKLIQDGTLRSYIIRERDLPNFEKMRLINALLPWGTGPEVDMDKVRR